MDFEAFFARTYPRVLAYARLVAPNDHDDVVSATFEIAWRRRDSIPSDAEIGWAIGVARRVAANRRRGERRLNGLRDRLLALSPPEPPDPADLATDGALRLALTKLAPRDREALLLVAWCDLSPAEAAQALGISAPAFRMRLARARRRAQGELLCGLREVKEQPS